MSIKSINQQLKPAPIKFPALVEPRSALPAAAGLVYLNSLQKRTTANKSTTTIYAAMLGTQLGELCLRCQGRQMPPTAVRWWFGVAVTALGISTKLLYIRPSEYSMDDRLWIVNHLSISSRHPGQLSLLPSARREMSTSLSAVMLCGWGVKAGMVHSTCE